MSALEVLLEKQPVAATLNMDAKNLKISPFLESIETLIDIAITRVHNRKDLAWSDLPKPSVSIPRVSNLQGITVVLLSIKDLVVNVDEEVTNRGIINSIIAIHHPDETKRLELYEEFNYLMPALSETIEGNLGQKKSIFFIIQAESQSEGCETIQTHSLATLRENVLNY